MAASCYMIYGPPGSGKSTLLKRLPHHGRCVAIDLEAVGIAWSSTDAEVQETGRVTRKALVEQLTQVELFGPLFFGCGNLGPEDFPAGSRIIFLHHPDVRDYRTWVDRRNQQDPKAADQVYEKMHEHTNRLMEQGMYDFVIRPAEFAGRPDEMARHVWSLIGSRAGESAQDRSIEDAQASYREAIDQRRRDLLMADTGRALKREIEQNVRQDMRARHSALKQEHDQLKSRHRELERQFQKTFRSRLLGFRIWWRALRRGGEQG